MSIYNLGNVKRCTEEALEASDTARALDIVRNAVDVVINNQRSVARTLASKDLDEMCRNIAAYHRKNEDLGSSSESTVGTVILATELAKAGGHVELIKDYIRSGEFPAPITLVLTDCFDRIDDVLSNEFSQTFGISVVTVKAKDSKQRVDLLTRRLKELCPQKMLLITHNQDSVMIVAALIHTAPEMFFIHHADHHLCLGVTCEEFIHVDVAQFAYCNCRNSLKNHDNRYWPIVFQGHCSARSPVFELSAGLTTCAVGREEKFEAGGYTYDYFKIIPEILHSTGGTHIHVGPLQQERLEEIHARLAQLGIDASRFYHVPWVASVATALTEYSVDMYLVSFPYGGAKSVIEAMAAGIPVLAHKNYRSLLTSSYFVAYPECYSWANTAELFKLLKEVTEDDLSRHSVMSRVFYEQNYTPAILSAAIKKTSGWADHQPDLRSYFSDGLQAFLDEERLIDDKQETLDLRNEPQ
ncbi:hypothetical protein [Rhizobium sp. AN95]|uniref:hypothetical protein n=1 Tax=Rhizobium sp. AN95 TaxID=3035216 RepID=UPI002B25BF6E|nr:hypothetical protein [Rhizobium sp. AN95]